MIKPDDSTITQHFQVEIITPTHIGGASEDHWQKGIDFVSKDGKMWILDFGKLGKAIPVETLSRTLTEGQSIEKLLIGKKLESLSLKSFDFRQDRPGDIKRHIFNGFNGKPFIPGSSLKGSISSILLKYFSQQYNISGNSSIVKNTLGDFENSIMRFFQFTDSHFEDTFLTSTKIFNLQKNDDLTWGGGWKHGGKGTNTSFNPSDFTTIYECLDVGKQASVSISFKKKCIEQLYLGVQQNRDIKIPPSHTAAWLTSFSFKKFNKAINDHTLSFLKKEIKFFEKYSIDENSVRLLEYLVELEQKIEKLDTSKECILRLAAGSGFHSITGDWQYADFINTGEHRGGKNDGKRKFKSRKLAFEKNSGGQWKFRPMGFIKLTMLSQEDIVKAENERIAKEIFEKEEKIRIEAEAIAIAEAALLAELEAKKPKLHLGPIIKNMEVDAEVLVSSKPSKVKIFVSGYESKLFDMIESAQQPVGYVCRVALVVEKGKLLRVRHLKPK